MCFLCQDDKLAVFLTEMTNASPFETYSRAQLNFWISCLNTRIIIQNSKYLARFAASKVESDYFESPVEKEVDGRAKGIVDLTIAYSSIM